MKRLSKGSSKPISKSQEKPGRDYDRKTKPYEFRQEIRNVGPEFYLDRMEILKANGLYRRTMFGTEIIWNGVKYHFTDPDRRGSEKNVFIFAMVKRDALAYIEKYGIKKVKQLPAVVENDKFKGRGREIWPADMDDAFWTIAYNLKIISQNTFVRGLLLGKEICNAALASLGSDKASFKIIKGKITKHRSIYRGQSKLKLVYVKIRRHCLWLMRKLAKLLGTNFKEYKTDCIYYAKTKKNIAMVEKFMRKNKLWHKGGVELDEAGKPLKSKLK